MSRPRKAADDGPRLVLYGTGQCGHCRQAKRFLRQQGLRFSEFDIQRNRRAWNEFQRLGGRGVPLILVDGKPLQGFDPKRLLRALRQAGTDV